MSDTVFRQNNINKVKSPDNLNEYIHVANPGVWVLLAAVIVLLTGLCVWGIFGQLSTEVKSNAQIKDGIATCYLQYDEAIEVQIGMNATIDGHYGTVTELSIRSGADSICQIQIEDNLPDGNYIVYITIDNIHPISFLFSRGD